MEAWLLGGDMAPFGAWPAETVARLRELPNATWIRGNTERWLVDPIPSEEPMAAAVQACREALGDELADELGGLPESARIDSYTLACHASPGSDMRSFMPEPAEDEAELLGGVTERRLVFGHTHLQFVRTGEGPAGPVELLNPGSVGMPLDGDHRAAYALVASDGTLRMRRVAYDHAASAAAVRERLGAAGEPAARRIERARFEVDD